MTSSKATTTTERNDDMTTLTHQTGCTAERIETTAHATEGMTATHCLNCGAHLVLDRDGRRVTPAAVTGGMHGHVVDAPITMEVAK